MCAARSHAAHLNQTGTSLRCVHQVYCSAALLSMYFWIATMILPPTISTGFEAPRLRIESETAGGDSYFSRARDT
jgi:hypothetical protein